MLGFKTLRYLPISPKREFDSVFILVDLSCTTEEREIETSFEVGSDFWLRGPGE